MPASREGEVDVVDADPAGPWWVLVRVDLEDDGSRRVSLGRPRRSEDAARREARAVDTHAGRAGYVEGLDYELHVVRTR